jgi:toxin ParE1/3/4
MKYVFHHESLAEEYTETVQYYAKQRAEVAQAFINSIEETIYKIREFPTRWAVLDEDVRRCLAQNFPYGILYTIEQDYILILAVMHCSRKPEYWKNLR